MAMIISNSLKEEKRILEMAIRTQVQCMWSFIVLVLYLAI